MPYIPSQDLTSEVAITTVRENMGDAESENVPERLEEWCERCGVDLDSFILGAAKNLGAQENMPGLFQAPPPLLAMGACLGVTIERERVAQARTLAADLDEIAELPTYDPEAPGADIG